MANTVEVWKNTTAGLRWVVVYDKIGREASKTIPGGRTFSLTTFERQLNQDRAASPEQDLFRNGSFILVRGSDDTDEDEIDSVDSLTDSEIENIVHEMMASPERVEEEIGSIASPITLGRIKEALVLSDNVSRGVIDYVKARLNEVEKRNVVEREAVSVPVKTAPKE